MQQAHLCKRRLPIFFRCEPTEPSTAAAALDRGQPGDPTLTISTFSASAISPPIPAPSLQRDAASPSPDDLYRRAKAEAALRGRKFRELIAAGLRLALEVPDNTRRPASLAELMERAPGVIDSGIPDLALNPEHLAGFGRDVRHR